MKFETLIWVFIFLIYIISVLIKKARAASKGGGTGIKPPSWKEKIENFLLQAQENVRKEEIPEEPAGEDSFPEIKEPLIAEPSRPETMVPARVARVKTAGIKKPGVSTKRSFSKDMSYGIKDLRKAVIWSEILAPPLALRDK